MSNLVLLILLSIANLLQGGNSLDRRIADDVKTKLGDRVGVVKAHVVRNQTRFLAKGQIDKVELSMTDLLVKPVRFTRASFEIEKLRINSLSTMINRTPKIDSIGDITWRAEITDGELSRALAKQTKRVSDPVFTLAPRGLKLEANYRLSIVPIPFSIEGRLALSGGKTIILKLDRATLVGIGLPQFVVAKIEKEFNPIINVDKLKVTKANEVKEAENMTNRKFDPRIYRVETGYGVLRAEGGI
jgi:hypothetical protein